MDLPSKDEFLDFAEGLAGERAQKKILALLGSSPLIREQVAEIKRDLYIVRMQIPDYKPSLELAKELNQVVLTWNRSVYERTYSLKNFYRSRELFGLMLFVAGAILAVIVFFGMMTR